MHLPDGYLSPQTCAAAALVMAPAWLLSARRLRQGAGTGRAPRVALSAAFAFLVMMLNVPVPGGTTAHAVGGALIAILLGPWEAIAALSTAVLIQALLFGDGGLIAYPANALNMALILPVVASFAYRLLAGRSEAGARRRIWAAAAAGYLGINAAALACALELGLQPWLFHTAGGTPLYAPYSLSQTVPAMMLAHLTVAGFAEAAITGGVVAFLIRAHPALLPSPRTPVVAPAGAPRRSASLRPALWSMAALALVTPLGLLAPGGAFAEAAPGALPLRRLGLSAIPEGLARYYGFWRHAVIGGYGVSGAHPVVAYLLSALLGIAAAGAVVFLLGRALSLGRRGMPAPDEPSVPA